MPALSISSDGTVDASSLGIVWDTDLTGDQDKTTYLKHLEASIRQWESVTQSYEKNGYPKALTIANLDLMGPSKSLIVTVGNKFSAREPEKTLLVPYIDPKDPNPIKGYFFFRNDGAEGAHEFGHLLGLADRYFEVYVIDDMNQSGNRSSAPMGLGMFNVTEEDPSNTPKYEPATNLMSNNTGTTWTLSKAQLDLVFNGQDETPKARNVIGIQKTFGTDPSFQLPPPSQGIILKADGCLYADTEQGRQLAAYNFRVSTDKKPFPKTAAKEIPIRRAITTIVDTRGPSTPSGKDFGGLTGKYAKSYRTPKNKPNIPGPYIHRGPMNVIGGFAIGGK